jgi:two-component system OmpR family response regulator
VLSNIAFGSTLGPRFDVETAAPCCRERTSWHQQQAEHVSDKESNRRFQMTNLTVSDKNVSFSIPDHVGIWPSQFCGRRLGACMTGALRRILVIEDDAETAEQLADSLSSSGYHVDLARDGEDGIRRGRATEYAVMTVDRMLPGVDGLAVIRRLRDEGIVTPALILSALGEIDDRVRGLRAGGDDYLVKPFAFAEFLARVEALARRSDTVVKETILRAGDLELDLVARTACRSGHQIDLLPREFQLLEYLVRNQGQVVPRAMLLQHVWDLHFDPATNIIDVYVGRVRRKVDGQQAYPLIHTIRGVGYCVRAPC